MGTEKKFGIGGFFKETLGFGGGGAAVGGTIGALVGGIAGGVFGFGAGAGPCAVAGLKVGAAIGGTLGGITGVADSGKKAITGKELTPLTVAKNWAKKKMIAYSVAADKSNFDVFVQKIKAIAFELFMQLKETLNMNSAGIAASKQNQVPSSGRGTNGQQPAGQAQSQAKAQAPVQAPAKQAAKQQPVNSAQNIGNAALKNVAPSAAKAAAPIVGKGAAIQNKSLTR